MQFIQILLSGFFILFLPGYVLSVLFFEFGKIDAVERLALSVGLSLAVVPLTVFYLNLAGYPITKGLVIGTVLGIVILAALGVVLKKARTIKKIKSQ